MTTPHAPRPNQFALLKQRRFAPFFWVQLLGAANDNLFKFAFTVMVAYGGVSFGLDPALVVQLIAALFILPFLLLSATSGQLADKFEKSTLIRFVKTLEIGIALLAVYGFVGRSVPVLLLCTVALGMHSALFGPVKYAYLPQHLNERELTGGNGMVEMGTFVAILLGNVAGGLLVGWPQVGPTAVAITCLALALIGRVAAQFVPLSPATDPTLRINWNPVTETWRNLKLANERKAVFRSLLGISWMWFFGAVFLTQFPTFAKGVLGGNEQVASLLLVVFSIGVATGALLCETLSRRQIEIGLVPFGAIGMSVFSIDLYFASHSIVHPAAALTFTEFVAIGANWRVMIDLLLLSLSAGLYSVPMYALIQIRSLPSHRSRIIAANNILNALFMIVSAGMAAVLLQSGMSVPGIFLVTGLLNALVAGYVFLLVPEYLLRFAAFILSHLVYRFRTRDTDRIPDEGAALLVCNHVSFVDAVLLMAASPRPIVFVMDHRIFATPLFGTLFRLARAIPIAPRKENPEAYEAAFERAAQVLRDGELLCVFPEGAITADGQLGEFRGGVMKILERCPVPVVPLALRNLWGSFFSRAEGGRAMVRPFRRGLFNEVELAAGEPIPAAQATLERLRTSVQGLLLA